MTVICGGGTSSAKAGYGASLAMTASAVAALLNNIPTPWAVGLAGYIGLVVYDLTQLCGDDPPPLPNITAADVLALVTFLDPIGHTNALLKFQQLVTAYVWYSVCQCDSVATPAPPAAPAAPPGMPTINPPGIAPPVGPTGSCYDQVTNTAMSNGNFQYASWLWHGTPSTLTSLRVTIHQGRPSAGTISPATWRIIQTGNAAIGLFYDVTLSPAFDQVVSFPVMAGATELRIQGTATYNQTERTTLEIEGFCGAVNPGLSGSPCCPADPVLSAQMEELLRMVTLIQRQKVPFAYIPGTRHNGLVGNGQLAVSGLLGVSVIITTLPSYIGNLAGDPTELFDVGFVTIGTADGWHRSVRIDHSPTLIMPIDGSETLVGYSLQPNVVVDILELVREA